MVAIKLSNNFNINAFKTNQKRVPERTYNGILTSIAVNIFNQVVESSEDITIPLSLNTVVEKFGISSTMAREILRTLQSKGIIHSKQHVGTFVRKRNYWNLIDLDVIYWRYLSNDANNQINDLIKLKWQLEPYLYIEFAKSIASGNSELKDQLLGIKERFINEKSNNIILINVDNAFHSINYDAIESLILKYQLNAIRYCFDLANINIISCYSITNDKYHNNHINIIDGIISNDIEFILDNAYSCIKNTYRYLC